MSTLLFGVRSEKVGIFVFSVRFHFQFQVAFLVLISIITILVLKWIIYMSKKKLQISRVELIFLKWDSHILGTVWLQILISSAHSIILWSMGWIIILSRIALNSIKTYQNQNSVVIRTYRTIILDISSAIFFERREMVPASFGEPWKEGRGVSLCSKGVNEREFASATSQLIDKELSTFCSRLCGGKWSKLIPAEAKFIISFAKTL